MKELELELSREEEMYIKKPKQKEEMYTMALKSI